MTSPLVPLAVVLVAAAAAAVLVARERRPRVTPPLPDLRPRFEEAVQHHRPGDG